MPAVSAMEPELEAGPRRKTPERRLVWRRMRLLLGCLTATPSADLLVDELPVDEADLMNGGEGWVLEESPPSKPILKTLNLYQLICTFTSDFDPLWKGRKKGRRVPKRGQQSFSPSH